MSSWASNPKDKLIFENWRSYLNEQKRIPIFKTIEDMVDDETLTLRQGRALLSRVIPDAILTAKVDKDNRAKIDISMLGIEDDNLQKVKDNIEKLFNQSDFTVDVVFDQDTQPPAAKGVPEQPEPAPQKASNTDKKKTVKPYQYTIDNKGLFSQRLKKLNLNMGKYKNNTELLNKDLAVFLNFIGPYIPEKVLKEDATKLRRDLQRLGGTAYLNKTTGEKAQQLIQSYNKMKDNNKKSIERFSRVFASNDKKANTLMRIIVMTGVRKTNEEE